MEDGWLDEEQPAPFVEVIDAEGESLGFLERRQASRLHLVPQTIETPSRYLDDFYVRNHARIIEEQSLYDGVDLNDVQQVILASNIVKRQDAVAAERTRVFEENMFINNAQLYKAYMDHKKQKKEAEGTVEVEQKVPGSVEEFLATLAAFDADDGPDSGKEQEENAEGWLSSFLSDEDLNEMSDDD